MREIPTVPDRDRLRFTAPATKVDREAGVIRGMVVAEAGPFKSKRGEFNQQSLSMIAEQINATRTGLRSRFSHPTESDDGLGKYLGRVRNARVEGNAVRADLHLDPTSFDTPSGNLGRYVMDLAASDPEALSSSLVLRAKKEKRLNLDGTEQQDEKGQPLPPLWYPEKLMASDIVDTGDAVNGLLSAGDVSLPNGVIWQATELLDSFLSGQTREVVEGRMLQWLNRYLGYRYGESEKPTPLQLRVKLLEMGMSPTTKGE